MHHAAHYSLALAAVLLVSHFQVSLTQKVREGRMFFNAKELVPFLFHPGDSYPRSVGGEANQCRLIRLRTTKNSRLYTRYLISNAHPDIIFHSAEADVMTPLKSRLNTLVEHFSHHFSVRVTVLKAWSDYSANDSDPYSLHYEGLVILDHGENTTTDVDDHFCYFQSFCPAFSHFVMIEQIDVIGTCSLCASSSLQNPGLLDPQDIVIHSEDSRERKRPVVLHLNYSEIVYVAVRRCAPCNRFTIVIWDAIFDQEKYYICVPEGAIISKLINLTKIVHANNIVFNFIIIEGNQEDYFSVGVQSSSMALVTSHYMIALMASDGGHIPVNSTEGLQVINLMDINDNVPAFSNESYEITICEDAPLKSTVLAATDADTEPINASINYATIASDPLESVSLFAKGNNSHIVILEQHLNYESFQSHLLVAKTARIINMDERHPIFPNNCDVNIVEGIINRSIPITQCYAVVIDESTGQSFFEASLTYDIISGNNWDTFSIGMNGTVFIERDIDREELDFYSLLIRVMNPSGQSNFTVLNITVEDVNDNAPIIHNNNLIHTISESDIQSGKTNFFQVNSTDADFGSNAELVYDINYYNASEDQMSMQINVKVSDSGNPPLSGSVQITLNFMTPCFLQKHTINATDGRLTSLFLCYVKLRPSFANLAIGDTQELECSFLSSRIQRFLYYEHNDSVVSSLQRNVTLSDVSFEDGGTYSCIVVSPIGQLKSISTIQILVPPQIIVAPKDMFIEDGETSGILQCSATGIPDPIITWTRLLQRTGRLERLSNNPSSRIHITEDILVISTFQTEDQGIYSCIASNPLSAVEASFQLSVLLLSDLVLAYVVDYNNPSLTDICHDTEQKKFEMILTNITGLGAVVIYQNGTNICNITTCVPSPCLNGGLCKVLNTSSADYECMCIAGYTGVNCEVEINECNDEDLCQSEGVCVNTPAGSFTCTCPEGVTGRRCQYRDICSFSTCPFDYTCIHTMLDVAEFICYDNILEDGTELLKATISCGGVNAVAADCIAEVIERQTLGALDDQVTDIIWSHVGSVATNDTKKDGNETYCNITVCNDGNLTCEARFILDPESSEIDSEIGLALVWVCPEMAPFPSEALLDVICQELFYSRSVSSCTSPTGLLYFNAKLPNTIFSFSFILISSTKTPLSGEQVLTRLNNRALSVLRLQGYSVDRFELVYAVPQTEPPATQTEPPATQTEPPATQTEPPATQTDPPATQTVPPATQTDPPATQTVPPATQTETPAAQTEPPATQTEPPEANSTIARVVIISNVKENSDGVIIGVSASAVVIILLAVIIFFSFVCYKSNNRIVPVLSNSTSPAHKSDQHNLELPDGHTSSTSHIAALPLTQSSHGSLISSTLVVPAATQSVIPSVEMASSAKPSLIQTVVLHNTQPVEVTVKPFTQLLVKPSVLVEALFLPEHIHNMPKSVLRLVKTFVLTQSKGAPKRSSESSSVGRSEKSLAQSVPSLATLSMSSLVTPSFSSSATSLISSISSLLAKPEEEHLLMLQKYSPAIMMYLNQYDIAQHLKNFEESDLWKTE